MDVCIDFISPWCATRLHGYTVYQAGYGVEYSMVVSASTIDENSRIIIACRKFTGKEIAVISR